MKNVFAKMKGIANKWLLAMAVVFGPALLSANTAFAAETNAYQEAVNPIIKLLNSLFAPAITLVVAVGTLYCIVLGVKFAKAEEPQEHEKAKNHLKNAIIGYVLIFILMVLLRLTAGPLVKWVNQNGSKEIDNLTSNQIPSVLQIDDVLEA
ncbi:MAG: pilin [Clostridiales bacterium]|nr:pilin [Clostridiales bacterium]